MNRSFQDPWALLSKQIDSSASRTVIQTGANEIRYSELNRAVEALAAETSDLLQPQDRVGVLLGMLPEYLVSDLMILRQALVKVPLNPMLSASEMAYILEHSGARILFTSSRLGDTEVAKVSEVKALLPHLVVIDVAIESLSSSTARIPAPAPSVASDAAAIYYTGGTTGKPKGAIHTRSGIYATILAHVLEAEIGSADILLLSTSLSHSAGSFAHAAISQGATLVLLDRFTPEAFCKTATQQRVTFAMVVPTMLYRLIDYLKSNPTQTPALHTLVYGSAPITPSRLQEAVKLFGPIFIQLFGQTECPNWGTSLNKRDHAEALVRPELLLSCGTPCSLADVRVVDETGNDVGPGESGEILLSAPYTMAGYWQNPEATATTLVNGWVHTGDIGSWDDQGYLYVRDRKSDMIITGGYNVYSSEVEAELQRIEGIAQVAVIGIPDSDWGEAVCALVVPREGVVLDENMILKESRELLGAYKRPKRIVILDEIPLTPFGKADKKQLRRPFWERSERAI